MRARDDIERAVGVLLLVAGALLALGATLALMR